MPSFQLVINVTCEKSQGKFVSKDDLIAAVIEEIQEPGTLYVDESEYEVTEFEISNL